MNSIEYRPRPEVVTDSGIFSDDLTKRCCVEGKEKRT